MVTWGRRKEKLLDVRISRNWERSTLRDSSTQLLTSPEAMREIGVKKPQWATIQGVYVQTQEESAQDVGA